ncbi:hypothetical protein [Streptomyces sp. H39-S7]|uniref:hypothetical protein n=1 Tax=Streptomyces sp. H39-S7 TaxID=3004357 RepID=UPI0022AFEDE3|nr:hypothetical protein [Streptomyces sp. H39-S7]MCZ4125586.1 hypothetical protein [Streptomyces sp. H39-S7]
MWSSRQADFAAERAAGVQAAVGAAVACALCPLVTAEKGAEILAKAAEQPSWTAGTAAARARAAALAGDPAWRQSALEWITAYWSDHGHGPTWGKFRHEETLWSPDTTTTVRRIAVQLLVNGGHLTGTRIPFGLRVREVPA